jgi:hypothetical protein
VSKYITNISEWAAKCIADPYWLAKCMQRIHRFGGQFEGIHVLGHSMEVASRLDRPIDKLWGLLHDAHEVLSGDVTRQFKSPHLLDLQAKCDDELLAYLYMNGVNKDVNRQAVYDVDAKVGDDEHENPRFYGSLYHLHDPQSFEYVFNRTISECRNAQPQ